MPSAKPAGSQCSATAIIIISRPRGQPPRPPRSYRRRKANWSAPKVAIPAALRLGCVKYLNARPLIHGWSGPVHFDHPSALCRRLAAGELDVALVSSFEYLRHPIYSIVDRLAIASDGPVFSVILVHLGAIEELREVVVDPASETSVNLLRCLLAERGLEARFVSDGEIGRARGQLLDRRPGDSFPAAIEETPSPPRPGCGMESSDENAPLFMPFG